MRKRLTKSVLGLLLVAAVVKPVPHVDGRPAVEWAFDLGDSDSDQRARAVSALAEIGYSSLPHIDRMATGASAPQAGAILDVSQSLLSRCNTNFRGRCCIGGCGLFFSDGRREAVAAATQISQIVAVVRDEHEGHLRYRAAALSLVMGGAGWNENRPRGLDRTVQIASAGILLSALRGDDKDAAGFACNALLTTFGALNPMNRHYMQTAKWLVSTGVSQKPDARKYTSSFGAGNRQWWIETAKHGRGLRLYSYEPFIEVEIETLYNVAIEPPLALIRHHPDASVRSISLDVLIEQHGRWYSESYGRWNLVKRRIREGLMAALDQEPDTGMQERLKRCLNPPTMSPRLRADIMDVRNDGPTTPSKV
jgi:hypothetical protein